MSNTPNSLVTNKMISTAFHFIIEKCIYQLIVKSFNGRLIRRQGVIFAGFVVCNPLLI